MKKLIFLFALCAFYCADVNAQQIIGNPPAIPSNPVIGQPEEGRKFIYIRFGRKSLQCDEFGLCVFEVNASVQDVITLITAIFKRTGLEVSFPAKFVAENKQYFKDNKFIMGEDFTLSAETARALGAKAYTIKKGVYPVVFDKSTNTYNCTF